MSKYAEENASPKFDNVNLAQASRNFDEKLAEVILKFL